jgi:hypothetical protein
MSYKERLAEVEKKMEEQRQKRREEIKRRINKAKEDRDSARRKSTKTKFMGLGKPYVHEKLEKEYNEKIVLPELEKKQKYLEELKEFYQPLSKSAFVSHQQSYEKIKKQKELEYKEKRENFYNPKSKKLFNYLMMTKFIDVKSFDPEKMMSVFMKRIVKEEVLQKQNSPREDIIKNKEKVGKYAKLIKDMHPPKVSKVKRKEMLALKEAVSNPRLFNKKPKIKDIKAKLNKSGMNFVET